VFGNPTTVTDECINVSDDKAGALGTACAGVDTLPKTFNYTQNLSYNTCGVRQYVNTASFLTNDTATTGSDSWTVNVTIPCATGCTLTQGYWKTHSSYGPAPYDDTWALLSGGLGANKPFYLSGQTWYQVFWTPPQGNPYYNLAHQFEAATLNELNGASTPANVDAALAWAHTFFSTHTPSSNLTKTEKAQVLYYANLLDNYNNGLVGPVHCSERA
jgi:hypothetical protein